MKEILRTRVHSVWKEIQGRPGVTPQVAQARLPKTPVLLGGSTKIDKGEKMKILTKVLYLSPSTESGRNLCPWATKECAAACLGHSSGQMIFSTSKNSRVWKTGLFLYGRHTFDALLLNEIRALKAAAERKDYSPAVRLNGTSDVVPSWCFARSFPEVQFYDYTKAPKRMGQFLSGEFPENYHLTYSFSGSALSENLSKDFLRRGGNVAVVFDELPETWWGYPVLNADLDDARFLDPMGYIAGLTFKGNKADEAGSFLVRTRTE